jgi:hypothetical protein
MQFNDKAYFTRKSETLVDAWTQSSRLALLQPNSPAFLSVEAVIPSAGTLNVTGLSSAGVTVTESISFDESSIRLSNNEYKSILTLTPSWSTYKITIKAEDKQGQPIQAATSFGPFPVSVVNLSSQRKRDSVDIQGWEKDQWLIVYIQSFQPETNDEVRTTRGWSGWAQDVIPTPHINFPTGWQFFLNISK